MHGSMGGGRKPDQSGSHSRTVQAPLAYPTILDEQDDASTAPLLLCAMSGAAALPLRAGAMR